MKNTKSTNRIPNITPLRFILALLVVIFHVNEFSENRGFPFFNDWAIFKKGTEAVYMFFSLSGFLIIKQLYSEKKLTQTINLKAFYLRRILRIFPLYYLVLFIGLFYYRFVLSYFGFEFENNYNLLHGILLSITFFPNIFATFAPGGILEILWSIGIEEQFYLFIAPMFFFLPLNRIKPFLIGFTIIYFLIYFSGCLPFLRKYMMLYFYFSFGGFCSILLLKSTFQTVMKKLKYPLFIIFIIYFSSTLLQDNLSSFQYHLISCILFGLVLSALSLQPYKILQNKAMNYLGTISYGVYMYHSIVLQIVGFAYLKMGSKLNLPYAIDVVFINVSVILLTILLAHLSFKYYESYFLKLKQKKGIQRIEHLTPKNS